MFKDINFSSISINIFKILKELSIVNSILETSLLKYLYKTFFLSIVKGNIIIKKSLSLIKINLLALYTIMMIIILLLLLYF